VAEPSNDHDHIDDSLHWSSDLSKCTSWETDYQRQARLQPGTAGTQCYMCHKMAHFLSSCPILAEYTQLGKVSRKVQNLVILGNGDPIPNDLMNCSWAAQVKIFYMSKPHLLKDPPLHIQANFVANLLKVHRKAP